MNFSYAYLGKEWRNIENIYVSSDARGRRHASEICLFWCNTFVLQKRNTVWCDVNIFETVLETESENLKILVP